MTQLINNVPIGEATTPTEAGNQTNLTFAALVKALQNIATAFDFAKAKNTTNGNIQEAPKLTLSSLVIKLADGSVVATFTPDTDSLGLILDRPLIVQDVLATTVGFSAPAGNSMAFGTYAAGVVAQAGYITISDAAGTPRRLLVG